ncbi:Fic family protein [Paenibacillus durus]|uniref:Toxin Fic n=1 Tax=Paenibacillus durus ATCC 35681 TaxID=1333534 RepID=A0A0F7F6P4_PAEDU|nr:Fic family protein [Paenibacillus durus]AKG33617.1 toxin Fic [Paenibacillus durus ATCC 35681]
MKPKYQMTVEQNIFVAKRNIIDYIWKSAKLEGFAVTYPDTEAIFNGLSVPGIKVNEIVGVNNLKHAWQFILDNLDYSIDLSYICKINQLVGGDNLIVQAGYLRKVPVSIGGTTWRPDMPDESQIKEDLSIIHAIESPTERAITLMLYLMRKQMFLDGNKRTAMLSANQVMISSGCGIISIPIEHQRAFTGLLVQYYESNDMETLKTFMYDYCIDGIQFDPVQKTVSPKPDKEDIER